MARAALLLPLLLLLLLLLTACCCRAEISSGSDDQQPVRYDPAVDSGSAAAGTSTATGAESFSGAVQDTTALSNPFCIIVIRTRLPPRSCLLGKILLLDGQYATVEQDPDDVEMIELGYERNTGEWTKAAPCHLLSPAHTKQHEWLSVWLAELFPERLIRRVYPAPLTGRSWPKTRHQLDRAARLHTASGAADAYAVLFISSAEDLQS